MLLWMFSEESMCSVQRPWEPKEKKKKGKKLRMLAVLLSSD